jgi:hypothetical protein
VEEGGAEVGRGAPSPILGPHIDLKLVNFICALAFTNLITLRN